MHALYTYACTTQSVREFHLQPFSSKLPHQQNKERKGFSFSFDSETARERKMEQFRDQLTMEMEDIEPTNNKLDDLALVVERAFQILEQEEKEAAKREQRRGKRSKTELKDNGPNPPPPLPQQFKDIIHEIAQGRKVSEETLVMQKRLYKTDVSGTHNRLSIPFNQIDQGFLTEGEKEYLRGKNSKKDDSKSNYCNYEKVSIIEPCLGRGSVNLCRWDMEKPNGKTSSSYVLNGGWNQVVKRNKLEDGIVVQLWALRIDQQLCFALVKLPAGEVEIIQS